QEVRPMGRSATGVKGITLDENDYVIDMDIAIPGKDVLIVTKNGYGKRTSLSEYRLQARGGKGIKTLSITEKKGPVVGHKVVSEEEDLMIVTQSGMVIRMNMSDVSRLGRYAQGVKLMTFDDDEVATVARVQITDEEDQKD